MLPYYTVTHTSPSSFPLVLRVLLSFSLPQRRQAGISGIEPLPLSDEGVKSEQRVGNTHKSEGRKGERIVRSQLSEHHVGALFRHTMRDAAIATVPTPDAQTNVS